jgi:hypothetical protein
MSENVKHISLCRYSSHTHFPCGTFLYDSGLRHNLCSHPHTKQQYNWLRHCATRRRSRVPLPMSSCHFSIHLILPVALWPWGGLSLQQKLVPAIFLRGREQPARKVYNLTTICIIRLSSKCMSFEVSHPYGPLWPITQHLTEMSTRSRKIMFLENRARPGRRPGNVTAIC